MVVEIALIIYKEYLNDSKINTIHYSIPISSLYLLDSKEINEHEGLGPLHFYAVSTTDEDYENVSDFFKDSIEEEKNKAKRILINYNKFIKNKTKIIYSDTDSFFYTKNDIISGYDLKKIIYIHKK